MAARYVMEQGVTYLIKEPKPDESLKIFASLVKHGARGFCITRVHPKRIRKRFELDETPILWITTSEVADEKCVHPSDLAKLNMAINDMLKNHENLVILLEGIEYLVTYNGFDSILRFVQVINDRIMVTSSRFIITLDPATLDSSSLHIMERDLTPIEDLSKLEITFSEFPVTPGERAEGWRPPLEEKLRKWNEGGFNVQSLDGPLKGDREEAMKAFQDFETFTNRATAIQDELRSMDTAGFQKEADSIRGKALEPSKAKEAEDELLALQVTLERRKKDETIRKLDTGKQLEEYRAKLRDWNAQGYNTGQLGAVLDGPPEGVRSEFERFESSITKLRGLREELLLMDTTGFEGEVESIRSRLMAPTRVNEVEDDIFRLKILIERRRKEDRRRKEEDERTRGELRTRFAQWKSDGLITTKLEGWETLSAAQARTLFETFEKDVASLREFETELSTYVTRGYEEEVARLRKLLRDVDALPGIKTELAALKARQDKGVDERRRDEFEHKIQEWKLLGYNVDRLLQLEKADADTVQKELVVFKIRVHRLKELEGELALLDTSGFDSDVAALQPMFKDIDRIPEVESRLTELRIKVKDRSVELRKGREGSGRRKRDMVDKMSVWLTQGYSVARLQALLETETDLDKIFQEFDRFERDIVRFKELAGRLKKLDVTGFEKEAADIQRMFSDISKVTEAEDAVSALEARIRSAREEAKRQAAEDEIRKRKALERIQSWKEQGLNVARLEHALEESMEVFKREYAVYSIGLEKLRSIHDELAMLDARGFEADVAALENQLRNVDNADAAEKALNALHAKIEDRHERERRDKEAEKEQRKEYIQKLLNWSSQGLSVERLEKAIDQPMDVLRSEFERYEGGLRRLEAVRSYILSLDLKGVEEQADRVRLSLNDPDNAEAMEKDLAALNQLLEKRDQDIEEREMRERKRSSIRERVRKMGTVPINVSRMDKFLDGDLETLENEFELFLEDVKKLRVLNKRFRELDTRGFEERASAIGAMLTDPESLARIQEELAALEMEVGRRSDAERSRRDELAARVAGWEKGGINVQSLKEQATGDLDAYEKAVAAFEKDLDDYRRSMEKLMKFEKEFIKPSGPVAEKVEPAGEEQAREKELGEAERKGIETAEKDVAARVAQIRKVVPRRRSAEDRIRLEQRLRSEHRSQMRRLTERKAARRRNRILAAACIVIVAALVILYFYRPPAGPAGLAIDGNFSDWQDIAKNRYPQNISLPDNIDIRQTAVTTQDGAVFCYVRTEGTIMKGFQNPASALYEGDTLRVYFDSDGNPGTGFPIAGIGADHMIMIVGWVNIAQEGFYDHYDTAAANWTLDRSDLPARASGSQLELKVDPKVYGLDKLATGGVVFELSDTDNNVDIVS